jgi:hypothetical protein
LVLDVVSVAKERNLQARMIHLGQWEPKTNVFSASGLNSLTPSAHSLTIALGEAFSVSMIQDG